MAAPSLASGSLEPINKCVESLSTLAGDFLQQVREIALAAEEVLNTSKDAGTNGNAK